MGGLLWRQAVRRGLWGGNRTWMAVFGVLATTRVIGRLAARGPTTVFREELAPGQGLLITHTSGVQAGDEPR